jgi:DDE family transposase
MSTLCLSAGSPDALVADIEAVLRELLAGLAPDPPAGGPGRPRILPATVLWTGLLVAVVRGFSSQLDLWRLLTLGQLWDYPRYPLSDQAIYARLAAGGTQPLAELFAHTSAVLAARLAPYAASDLAPFATEVVALDHTRLDPIARRLPALRELPLGDARLLPGQLAGLFDLRRQQWRQVQFIADPHQNEKVTARELVATLPEQSLLLCDLGFFGFAWFDDLTDQGQWYVSRLRQRTSYTVIHTFYAEHDTFDGLVWLGAYRADRAKHAVRLVRFRHQGQRHTYLTNVLDPHTFPLAQIARLYARRWDFELAANLVKQHLGLHLTWSAKDVLIQQQLWAVLLISQILQALRLELAARAGVDPFDVSLALMIRWLPRLAATGQDPLQAFLDHGRAVRFIRPSTRTTAHAPTIPPDALTPIPPTLCLERTPRHANRKCGPRSAKPEN